MMYLTSAQHLTGLFLYANKMDTRRTVLIVLAALLALGGVACFLVQGGISVPISNGQSLVVTCHSVFGSGKTPPTTLSRTSSPLVQYERTRCDSYRRNKATIGVLLLIAGALAAMAAFWKSPPPHVE